MNIVYATKQKQMIKSRKSLQKPKLVITNMLLLLYISCRLTHTHFGDICRFASDKTYASSCHELHAILVLSKSEMKS